MKKITLLIASIGMTLFSLQAQLSLVGLHWNDQASQEEFVRLNTFTGSFSVVDTIPGVTQIAVGRSAFNNTTGTYVFYGRTSSGPMTQYQVDAATGNVVLQNAASGSLPIGAQWDMRTGKVYALEWDDNAREEWLVELNVNTGARVRIGIIPGVTRVQVGTFALDDANGEFYFVGGNDVGINRLYRISVSNAQVISSPIIQQNLFELEYDIALGKLIGLSRPSSRVPLEVVEIDPASLALSPIYSISSLNPAQAGVYVGSVDFDQNSHTYIFGARDNAADSIFLVDIVNMQHRAIPRNENVIEVACDNTAFAKTFFEGATNVDRTPSKERMRISPNPVSNIIRWELGAESLINSVVVHDLQGRVLIEQTSSEVNQLDVQSLRPGSYILSIMTREGWMKKGFTKL